MKSAVRLLWLLLCSTPALCRVTSGRIGQVQAFERELEDVMPASSPSPKEQQTQTQEMPTSTTQGQAGEGPTLKEAVEHVAGPERSLILAVTSSTYLDFVENWMLSVSRVGYKSRVLFMAEDQEAFDFLSSRWPGQAHFSGKGRLHLGDATKNSSFSSPYFRSIVDRKPEYISQILAMNVSVLFNDMDIVWLADPYPYFTGDYDMWVQEDTIYHLGQKHRFRNGQVQPPIFTLGWTYSICTCFMMIKPTEASKKVVQTWKLMIEEKVKRTKRPVHDQPELHKLLENTPARSFKVGVLNVDKFPSGCLYFEGGKGPTQCDSSQHRSFKESGGMKKTVVVHNNWIEGHDVKLERFKEYGLWFVEEVAAQGGTNANK